MNMNREPAVWVALIEALVLLVVLFGVELSSEQIAGIMALVVASGAAFVRTSATPVDRDTLEPLNKEYRRVDETSATG